MKKSKILVITILLIGVFFSLYSLTKANKQAFNIVAFGDSITYGSGDPEKLGYIHRVRVKLAEEIKVPVQLHNYGVSQYTTDDTLKQLQDRKARKRLSQAQVMTLYIGTNDFRRSAKFQFDQLDERSIQEGMKKYSKNLYLILETFRKENNQALIFVLGLYHPYSEFDNQQEILNTIEIWNKEIKEVSQQFHNTHYVPILDLFLNQSKEIYFSDSLHPNPAGYTLIANRLFDEIIKVKPASH